MKGITLPALTLWQPWATFVVAGFKPIETRTHGRYRSLEGKRIAIHSALRKPKKAELDARFDWLKDHGRDDILEECGWFMDIYPRGYILGTALVDEVRFMTPDDEDGALCDYYPGAWAYVLNDARRFAEPIPCKGEQGIWHWYTEGESDDGQKVHASAEG